MRRPRLACDDERTQAVLELLLWHSWGVDDLRRHIAHRFPVAKPRTLQRVAQRVCDIHCCGNGYTSVDIARQLRKLMPRKAV